MRERGTSLILMVVASFLLVSLAHVKVPAGIDSRQATGWPRLLLLLMLVLSAAGVLRGPRQSRPLRRTAVEVVRRVKTGFWLTGMRGTWPVFACVLYVLLWNVVGFFVATPIYLVVMARLLGEERLWVAVGSAGAITAALWALFVKLFYLPLPVGIGIFRGLNLLIFYGKL